MASITLSMASSVPWISSDIDSFAVFPVIHGQSPYQLQTLRYRLHISGRRFATCCKSGAGRFTRQADRIVFPVFKLATIPELQGAVAVRPDPGRNKASILPLHIDGIATPGTQALHRPAAPIRRQRGQEADKPFVALQKHLRDARGEAEIAIDLERRMLVKQVVIGRLRQERVDVLPRPLAVQQPGPVMDDPRAAPACMTAVGQPRLKRPARRRHGGGIRLRDLRPGKEREQV